jgi:HK97 family phage prohead protease
MTNDDTLICYGGDIKAEGEGKFGGYVVRWGSPQDADRQGEFFHPGTDFWGKTTAGLAYHHGIGLKGDDLAGRFGKRKIADVSLKADDVGLRAEGMLNLDDPDEARLYERIKAGEMGFSSGSADRFVARAAEGGKRRIDAWPLFEVSVTPRPVDPRNRAVAIKALIEAEAGEAVAATLVDRAEALVADAEEVVALFAKAADQRQGEGRNLSERKRDAVKALRVSLDDIYLATAPMPTRERLAALKRKLLAARIGAQNG